ncbi:MAG: 50S ribosomal protein L32 [Elusimicrobiota bacterium]|jgi:large subunit ribosomal protein L32
MPNPKRKHTRSRRDSRRSANWRLEPVSASTCSNCAKTHPPHCVCPHCGFYAGELVLPKREKKGKGKSGGTATKEQEK